MVRKEAWVRYWTDCSRNEFGRFGNRENVLEVALLVYFKENVFLDMIFNQLI